MPEQRGDDGSLGFIGFFESIDDADVATRLFDEAARWLRQRGRQRIRGPVSPSMNYEAGLLVEGFRSQPTFLMPHNLEYYGRLWEGYGCEPVQDLFAFGMLDYSPIVKRIRGRLFPFGFLRMLTERRSIKKARIVSANVVPEYQRWGLGLSLMGRLAVQGIQWGIEEVEFSYVLESNHLARATLEHGGATRVKTYRVFEKKM